jgi:hypothetical protein
LRCQKANTQNECEQSLKRKATWIPLYDDYIEYISDEIEEDTEHSFLPLRDSKLYSADDWKNLQLIAFRPVQYYTSQPSGGIWNDSQPNYNHEVLRRLYSMGPDYLYGMLFNELFDFHQQIIPSEYYSAVKRKHDVTSSSSSSTTTTTTTTTATKQSSYVIHSRHFTNSDDGSDTKSEVQCLHKMIGSRKKRKQQNHGRKEEEEKEEDCVVYLMSDREVTIDLLTKHIKDKYPYCTPIVATHDTALGSTTVTAAGGGSGHYKEHGIWAGTGFIQDLMLGSLAQTGFIGHCYRSSSQLLREMIVHNRHQDGMSDELQTCCLPST